MKFSVQPFSILYVAPLLFTTSMGHQSTDSDALDHSHSSLNKGEGQYPSMAHPSIDANASAYPTEVQDTPRKMEGTLLVDWELCTSSSSCHSGCCTAKYSHDERLRCTRLNGGYHADICVEASSVVMHQPQEQQQQVSTTTNSQSTVNGTCGYGRRGNGVCADGTCCSEFGWCGTSASICEDDARLGSTGSTTTTSPPPESNETSWCGNGDIGNGICLDGTCCSKSGWCGTTVEHCTNDSPSETLMPVNITCGYGEIGNGICPAGTCCSADGWCVITDCQSAAPSMAPTIAVPPGGRGNASVNETLPIPPTDAPSSQQQHSQMDHTLVYVLLAIVIFISMDILVRRTVIMSKFCKCRRQATTGSRPEGQAATPRKEPRVLYPLVESSVAGESLYSTLSRKWSRIGSSIYPSRPVLEATPEVTTSVEDDSSSESSFPPMVNLEMPNDEQGRIPRKLGFRRPMNDV